MPVQESRTGLGRFQSPGTRIDVKDGTNRYRPELFGFSIKQQALLNITTKDGNILLSYIIYRILGTDLDPQFRNRLDKNCQNIEKSALLGAGTEQLPVFYINEPLEPGQEPKDLFPVIIS